MSIFKVVSRCFLLILKFTIRTEPVKDKEHGGALIVVRKTLICSPKVTCITSRNISVAGVKKLPCCL